MKEQAPEPYTELVRAHFAAPVHAGDLASRYACMATGSAAESAAGCRVTLTAGVEDGFLREMRFRAFGCPHLVAAAEEWCRCLEGSAVASARPPATADLMGRLGVPVAKTGRMLLLEDAWEGVLQMLDQEPDSMKPDKSHHG